ncbi:MAG: hypothetical protein EOO36_19770, partial [Cytophagaceae bacterium]
MPLLRFFLALLFLLPLGALHAQTRPATAPRPVGPSSRPQPVKGTPVDLLHADDLRGGDFNGVKIRKLLGSVSFKQQDVFLYCDSAYQYLDRNEIEAFSNVRIVQSDTMTIT